MRKRILRAGAVLLCLALLSGCKLLTQTDIDFDADSISKAQKIVIRDADGEEKAERMLTETYIYFVNNPEKLPHSYLKFLDKFSKEQVVCDYISSMTDRYAVYTFNKIFVPKGWTFIDESN